MSIKKSFLLGLRPDEKVNLLEWSDKYFYLPRESSSEHGKYRSSRTPMVKEVLEELSPASPTQQIVVMKPTQLAGTTAAILMMLASVDVSPGPGLAIFPTEQLARSFSKKKLQPSIDATVKGSGRLKGKIKDVVSRSATDSTILEKVFDGGSWRLAGSNSPAIYRSESVRYLIMDDLDGIDRDIGGEGDPTELADRRTGTFSNRKIFLNSTPTLKGLSNIEFAYNKSSQGKFNVPCPHCKEYQYLTFPNLKFKRNSVGSVIDVWYECEHCNQRIDEHHKDWMLENGKYIHKYPERKIRGFHYSALCTPMGWVNNWKRIVRLFLDSKDNAKKLQVFHNTILAEPFEEKGSQPNWEKLKGRCDAYQPLTVPNGGYILSMGVDVHKTRLNVVIRAFGRGEESYLVYACEIFGDIVTDEPWTQLTELINQPYKHVSGIDLHIISVGIDSGDFSQIVYNYCRDKAPRVFPVKGQSQSNKPIIGRPSLQDVSYQGTIIKDGIQLWPVGSSNAKTTIYSRLQLTEGPGAYHFYMGTPEDYFTQLTGEKQITTFTNGYPQQKWTMIRANHYLDAEAYCLAAAIKVGVQRMNFDELEKQFEAQKEKAKELPKQQNKPVQRQQPQPQQTIARSSWMTRG